MDVSFVLGLKTERYTNNNDNNNNIEYKHEYKTGKARHPFLRFRKNPPNNGNYVKTIDDLIPPEINLTDLLRKNGTLQKNNKEDEDNKEIEINKNINENMTIKDVVINAAPKEWEEAFHSAMNEFIYIDTFISVQEQVYGKFIPNRCDLFKAFDLCPLSKVKVVIVGENPYHTLYNGDPISNGLAFSVNDGYSIPPQLNNIYKEISRSMSSFNIPSHGNLSNWAKQGVLLLNVSLTANPNIHPKQGSHEKLWSGFITKIILAIEQANPQCIYVLWGYRAQSLSKIISSKCTLLESSSPSPFYYKRGFYGCDHFIEINSILTELGSDEIDWSL